MNCTKLTLGKFRRLLTDDSKEEGRRRGRSRRRRGEMEERSDSGAEVAHVLHAYEHRIRTRDEQQDGIEDAAGGLPVANLAADR